VPVPVPALPLAIVAPPGAAQLLSTLKDEERQLLSLVAYAEAESYLSRAEVGWKAAARSVSETLAVWTWAKAGLGQALAAKAAAQVVVNAYKEAITQLAMAEYTGQSMVSKSNIGSQEVQLVKGELAGFAASDTTDALLQAESHLATCKREANAARALDELDWGLVQQANGSWLAAVAQVATSEHALSIAHGWVLQAGAAPARPAVALMSYEGKWAPPQKLHLHSAPSVAPANSSAGAALAAGAAVASTEVASTEVATTEAASTEAASTEPATTVTSSPGGSSTTAAAKHPGPDWALKGPDIFGPSLLSAAQIAAWYASTGAVAHTTIPLARLINDYMKAGRVTGVRADIAFAQSMDETAYFSFPGYGQDAPSYNNFAGIGACNKCKHGWTFPNAMAGVLAQQTLLESYATPVQLSSADAGSTQGTGVAGCCKTWISIGGIWSTNPSYGFEILAIYNKMLAWVLATELQQFDLASPLKPGGAGAVGLAATQPAISAPTPSHSPQT
jgi:hypothetical protein